MLKKVEDVEVEQQNSLGVDTYFSTPVYSIHRPDFLSSVKRLSKQKIEEIEKERGVNKDFPVTMTGNFFDDTSIKPFVDYVGQTSWNILSDQGFAMQNMTVQFTEMWTQKHYKHSLMEQHTHRFGSQLVGFYFLEVPTPSPRALFYDPRQGAVQGSLPEADPARLSFASSVINYEPKPGLLMFTNSWLAHSFTKNTSKKPFSFVHFNLVAMPNFQPVKEPEVEVV